MKQLIYVSRPVNEVDPQLVKDILQVSFQMNSDHGISGLLVCDGEYFLQCIEGEDKAVDQLYANICKDTRHYDIKLIGSIAIDKKDFKEWEMGYVSSREEVMKAIEALNTVTDFTPYEFTLVEARSVLERLISLV